MLKERIIFTSFIAASLLQANDVIKLEDVVTIGTKTQSSISDLPMQVTLISNEEIENSGASNVGEILTSEGSIYLNTSGSNGATMSIRGMAHADTLILIDGKRVNGEFSKSYELDRIPTSMIERIEIVKGSSSLLYGSDAMGGVINIITKKSKKAFSGDIQLTHGKNKNSADVNLLGTIDKTSYKLYSTYLKRDAFKKQENTDVKIMHSGVEKSPSDTTLPGAGNWGIIKSNLNDSYLVNRSFQDELELKTIGGGLSHIFNDYITIDFDASYLEEDKSSEYISILYESNYIASGTTTIKTKYIPAERYDKNKRQSYSLGFDIAPSNDLSIKYNLSYSQYDKDRKVYTNLWEELGYASKENSLSSVNKSTIKHTNNDFMGIYKFSDTNRITAGAEYRITNVNSTAYSVDDRKYKGLFTQHEYKPFENLNLVYGVRYDKDSIGEDETSFSFGTTFKITQDTKLKANYSQGFRSPDDRELYVDQTSPSGKKVLGSTVLDTASGKNTTLELKPETSETIEIGLITQGDIWNFDISLFKTNIEDRISQISYTDYMTFENINDSEIKGYETTLTITPIDQFLAKITYSRIDAKNKTDNEKLTYTPEELSSLTLSYLPLDNIELKTITKYTGTQVNSNNEEIKDYCLTNLKLIYKNAFKSTDLFAGINNIFRETLPEDLGAIEKSDYYFGIKYTF